ncbi:serine carboxypeptidase II-3-like isoform X1 [Zingiber officinale]|uniref:serine carboxypeptidase II-3-like isoform X1 n=1 Tax=Zingiber officinale TaxID=94328 RepID=UPI001C4CAD15|nr:serine carboxypeptidase II-3-like isoform X1 [Zingiber officinale]
MKECFLYSSSSSLLLFLLCLLHCITCYSIRQGDDLNKFYFINRARRSSPSSFSLASSLSTSDLKSKVYDNHGLKEGDKVIRLPGQPDGVNFNQYAGYVMVDNVTGRALFYYFVEADKNNMSKPLVLWLNGGPGCSSLGYGAMEELGPFRVMSDGKTLYENPYAWNTVANVLFLESPAGVGFSYSNTTSDYAKSGDKRTAIDSLAFLLNWFERFPEYKGREFFIAGESYAGHYVPQLALAILHHNDSNINLKGIAIGNGVINYETDSKGLLDYFWTHALIADETIHAIHKFCNFSPEAFQQPLECQRAVGEVSGVIDDLDLYNIYAPLCFSSGVTPTPKPPSIENFDPCTPNYVEAYLNNPEVQKALHANVTKLNYTWSACSEVIRSWSDQPFTILPIIDELLSNKLRILKYSGDIDGRVPVTSTRYSLNELGLAVKSPWRAWMLNNEVGGYTTVYEHNLTFATVRGAGHEVPSYQPARALQMIKSFLQGVPLPGA